MYKLLASVFVAVIALPVSGAIRAIIPSCCTGSSFIEKVDPATGAIVGHIDTGAYSNGAFSAGSGFTLLKDGKGAVVQSLVYTSFPFSEEILTVVDFTTGQVFGTMPVPSGGYSVAVDPQTGVLYLGYLDSSGDNHIQETDPVTLAVIRDVDMGSFGQPFPAEMAVSPKGDYIFMDTSYVILRIRKSTLQESASVSLACSTGLAFSPDGEKLYVETCDPTAMYSIDTATLRIEQSVPVSGVDWAAFGLSPDGSTLYVANGASLVIVDTHTFQITSTIASPISNGQLVVSPDGTVYVGSPPGYEGWGQISTFDPVSGAFTAIYYMPGGGDFALTTDGKWIYYYAFQTSTVQQTEPAPSTAIAQSGISGWATGGGVYDPRNNVLLSPGGYNINLSVLDGDTMHTKAVAAIPAFSGLAIYADGQDYVISNSGIATFDPQTLAVGAGIPIPCLDDHGSLGTPAVSGHHIYFPVSRPPGHPQCTDVAVFDTQRSVFTAMWPFTTRPVLAIAPDSTVGYAVFQSYGGPQLVQIDLATGAWLKQVDLPKSSSTPLLAISPDGATLYVAINGTLYSVATDGMGISGSATGVSVEGFLSVTPDGNYIYTYSQSYNPPAVTIFSNALTVVGTIPTTVGAGTVYFKP